MRRVKLAGRSRKSRLAFHPRSLSPQRNGLPRILDMASSHPVSPPHSLRRWRSFDLRSGVRTWALGMPISAAMSLKASKANCSSPFGLFARPLEEGIEGSMIGSAVALCDLGCCCVLRCSLLRCSVLRCTVRLRSSMMRSDVRDPSFRCRRSRVRRSISSSCSMARMIEWRDSSVSSAS